MLSDLEKRIKKSLAIGFTALTFLSPTIIPNFTNRANAASVRGKYDLFIHWKHPEAPSLNLEFIPYAQKNGGAWYPIVLENIHSEIRPDTTFYTGIMRAFDGGNYNFKMKARYKDSSIPSTEFSNIFNKSFAEINLNDVTPPSLTLNPLNYIPEEEKLIISGTINDNQDGYDLFIDGNPIELNKENKETHKWSKTIPYENIVNNQIIVKARDVMWNETVKTIAVSLDNVINNYYYNFLEDGYNTIPVEVDGENFTSLEADPLNSDSNNAKYLAEIQIPIIDPEKDYCIDFESNIEGKDQELEIILSDSSQNKLPLRFRLKEGHHYNMADIKTMVYDASKISEFNYDEISEQIAVRILNVEELIGFMREDKIYMGKIELREKGEVLSGRMVPTSINALKSENITEVEISPSLESLVNLISKDRILEVRFDSYQSLDLIHNTQAANTNCQFIKDKNGIYLNTNQGFINFGNNSDFYLKDKFTILYSLFPTESGIRQDLISKYENNYLTSLDSKLHSQMWIYDGSYKSIKSTTQLPLDSWSEIAFVFDRNNGRYEAYVNGILETSINSKNFKNLYDNGKELTIGVKRLNSLIHNYSGGFDNLIIEKRAYSPKEIKIETKKNQIRRGLIGYWDFDNKTNPMENRVNSSQEINNSTSLIFSNESLGIYFPNLTDYLILSDSDEFYFDKKMSIAYSIFPLEKGKRQDLVSKNESNYITSLDDTLRPQMWVYDGSYNKLISQKPLEIGQWSDILFRYNQEEGIFIVEQDHIETGSANSSTHNKLYDNKGELTFGVKKINSLINSFNGGLDYLAIWNRDLDNNEKNIDLKSIIDQKCLISATKSNLSTIRTELSQDLTFEKRGEYPSENLSQYLMIYFNIPELDYIKKIEFQFTGEQGIKSYSINEFSEKYNYFELPPIDYIGKIENLKLIITPTDQEPIQMPIEILKDLYIELIPK